MGMIASKAIRNEGWTTSNAPLTVADMARWAATKFETSRNHRMVYEQHPFWVDCSNERFVPDGFEVFTPGDYSRTEPAQRLDTRKGPEDVCSTHPIIVKDAVADLHKDIPSCLLECQLHVLSRTCASLDEQQTFLFRPQRSFFGCHLSISLSRSSIIRTQVGFVADQDARQMRVRVLTNVPEPCPGIQET